MNKKELEKQKADAQKKVDTINAKLAQIAEEEKKKEFDYLTLKSFGKCCKVTGDNPKDEKFSQGSPDTNAYEMLKVCAKAINGNKKVVGDRYYPYFNKNKKPGSGFCDGDYSYGSWYDAVSFRLASLDSPRAIFFGKTFEKLWYTHIIDND